MSPVLIAGLTVDNIETGGISRGRLKVLRGIAWDRKSILTDSGWE
jgi:hypothetical protein